MDATSQVTPEHQGQNSTDLGPDALPWEEKEIEVHVLTISAELCVISTAEFRPDPSLSKAHSGV